MPTALLPCIREGVHRISERGWAQYGEQPKAEVESRHCEQGWHIGTIADCSVHGYKGYH
jgi:hypothetical protein